MRTAEDLLEGGLLNLALANELGKLTADFTGRGATKSRVFIDHDVIVCLLEDHATKAETNLGAAGKDELVRAQRDALHQAMSPRLVAVVERLSGRTVRKFLSGTSQHGEDSVQVFILHPAAPDT